MNDKVVHGAYLMAELAYENEHPKLKNEELFPLDWYSIDAEFLKLEILSEALDNNCLIVDTVKYNEFSKKM